MIILKEIICIKSICYVLLRKTTNVEPVVLLSQQKPDDHIDVDLELDELDITSAETKATYREI